MKIVSSLLSFAFILLCSVLTGCLSPKGTYVNARYYTFPSQTEDKQLTADITVSNITVADYLLTPKIVVRESDVEVSYQPFDLWANDLRASLAEYMSMLFHSTDKNAPSHPVYLHVTRFEGNRGGFAHVQINQTDIRTGKLLRQYDAKSPWESGDIGDLVRALDKCLQGMAQQMIIDK